MSSTSTKPAGAGADNTGTGSVAWVSPGRVVASDDSRTSASALASGGASHYLVSSAHGFAIPAGANILGIQVNVERSADRASAITDSKVRLVKAGVIQTPDRASGSFWPLTTDAVANYGGAADLWSGAWTPADINDANFGVALSATNATATNTVARVDYIEIVVTYNPQQTLTSAVSAGSTVARIRAASVSRAVSVGSTVTRSALVTIARAVSSGSAIPRQVAATLSRSGSAGSSVADARSVSLARLVTSSAAATASRLVSTIRTGTIAGQVTRVIDVFLGRAGSAGANASSSGVVSTASTAQSVLSAGDSRSTGRTSPAVAGSVVARSLSAARAALALSGNLVFSARHKISGALPHVWLVGNRRFRSESGTAVRETKRSGLDEGDTRSS